MKTEKDVPADLSAAASAKAKALAQEGWTLVELMVVMSLIIVLSTLALAQYKNSIRQTKEAVLKADLFHMRESIDQYYADKGSYPQDIASLASAGYIRQIPKDPFTNSTDTWQTEMSEPDPANPSEMTGIKTIRSGAPGTALDGTNYSDW